MKKTNNGRDFTRWKWYKLYRTNVDLVSLDDSVLISNVII